MFDSKIVKIYFTIITAQLLHTPNIQGECTITRNYVWSLERTFRAPYPTAVRRRLNRDGSRMSNSITAGIPPSNQHDCVIWRACVRQQYYLIFIAGKKALMMSARSIFAEFLSSTCLHSSPFQLARDPDNSIPAVKEGVLRGFFLP